MSRDTLIKLAQTLLRRNSWVVAIFQAGLICTSLVIAWLLRFDFSLPERDLLFSALPILIVVRLAAIARFGLLHGWWRYVGISDALDILKADVAGSIGFFVVMRFMLGVMAFPRSVYVLEAVLTGSLLAGVRVLTRILVESVHQDVRAAKPVVLIGAGFAAQMILRELQQPGSPYQVIACFDDDRSKRGLRIQGVPVAGTVDELPVLLQGRSNFEVIIAVPSATGAEMRRFVTVCEQAGAKFRTVPALRELISGKVTVKQLREVSLDDLLGRDPVKIDLESVRGQLQGRAVVVTGAAGSIGSELCRQILEYAPAQLVCVDQSETGIFSLQGALADHTYTHRASMYVANVRDAARMEAILRKHKVEVVFHAAAYKHVPVMEANVSEAVNNNVFALVELLGSAERAGCKQFVLISSDKAVNPASVMGASKRICELIVSSYPAPALRCVSVRFGNVLGSSGSVVTVLQRQLSGHRPLTITHPEMTRFFMTIREAVTLVLQAFALGHHGDILVLDMGEPVRIVDLARSLVRLSGQSEQEVTMRFTGLREGEKLREELFYETEKVLATTCQRIMRTNGASRDWSALSRQLEELRLSLTVDGSAPIRAKIKEIVPEYGFGTCPLKLDEALTEYPKPFTKAAASK